MMPNILKTSLILFVLLSWNSAQSQALQATSHPAITETETKNNEVQRIYHFNSTCEYTIIREEDRMELLEGHANQVDITSLVPGVYFIHFQDAEGKRMLDRFTIDWE